MRKYALVRHAPPADRMELRRVVRFRVWLWRDLRLGADRIHLGSDSCVSR